MTLHQNKPLMQRFQVLSRGILPSQTVSLSKRNLPASFVPEDSSRSTEAPKKKVFMGTCIITELLNFYVWNSYFDAQLLDVLFNLELSFFKLLQSCSGNSIRLFNSIEILEQRFATQKKQKYIGNSKFRISYLLVKKELEVLIIRPKICLCSY